VRPSVFNGLLGGVHGWAVGCSCLSGRWRVTTSLISSGRSDTRVSKSRVVPELGREEPRERNAPGTAVLGGMNPELAALEAHVLDSKTGALRDSEP
jgi:hypothetical protein